MAFGHAMVASHGNSDCDRDRHGHSYSDGVCNSLRKHVGFCAGVSSLTLPAQTFTPLAAIEPRSSVLRRSTVPFFSLVAAHLERLTGKVASHLNLPIPSMCYIEQEACFVLR